jgi:hypothetical protein
MKHQCIICLEEKDEEESDSPNYIKCDCGSEYWQCFPCAQYYRNCFVCKTELLDIIPSSKQITYLPKRLRRCARLLSPKGHYDVVGFGTIKMLCFSSTPVLDVQCNLCYCAHFGTASLSLISHIMNAHSNLIDARENPFPLIEGKLRGGKLAELFGYQKKLCVK